MSRTARGRLVSIGPNCLRLIFVAGKVLRAQVNWLSSLLFAYLIDWHTAGIVLVGPFCVHQLGGEGILAATSRTGGCRRRRQVMAIEINIGESFIQGTDPFV
jgi:hypothetical protein